MSRGGRRGVPPDLKGTLGTLIRTTIDQVGAMTDVARRQARSQKHRLDTALLERRRRESLAELGEILYELAVSGEIELDELPELAQAVQDIAEIDRRIAEAGAGDRLGEARRPVRLERTGGARSDWRPAPSRERVWRPDPDAYADSDSPWPQVREPDRPDRENRESRPVEPAGSGRRAREERQSAERETVPARPEARPRAEKDARRRQVAGDSRPARGKRGALPASANDTAPAKRDAGGGIIFVEDDSAPSEVDPDDGIEAYMNEDDVPRRR
jgi:hypothetical protein